MRNDRTEVSMATAVASRRLLEVHPEALRFGLESQGTVEGVRPVLSVALVGQQLHLVTPRVPCIDEQSLDHPSSDAAAAVLVADVHRLDERCRPTCIGDVRHDQQCRRADCIIAVPGEVHGQVVGQEHPSPRPSLAFSQVTFGKAWPSVDETCDCEEVVGAGRLDRIQTLHEVEQRPAPLRAGLLAHFLVADVSIERDGFGLVRRCVEM